MLPPSFADLIRLNTLWWRLATESQAVIAYRLLDASGLRGKPTTELARAVAEKPGAFAEAAMAAGLATIAGQRPDQIASASLTTLQKRTGANERRLRRLR